MSGGAHLSVSVVVAARDAASELGSCLASLERLDYPPERYELLVVDNGSSDGTAEVAGRHAARLLREPRAGVGYARNAGIEAADGEVVAFTDPDCRASTRWLRELVACFADARVGAVAGAIVPFPPRTHAERYAARRLSHSQLRPLHHPERPFGMTPNLAFRRQAIVGIGMFDTAFPGGGFEDADACWRLSRETGLELRYAPRAVVFHHYRSTGLAFLAQHYRYGYGLGLLCAKYERELPGSWRARAGSLRPVAVAAGHLARAALLRALAGRADVDSVEPRFDLLRQLGQRAGFLHASLVAGRALGGRR